MNLRPLNRPSPDPGDPGPLCPADFLRTGSRYLDLIPLTDENDSDLVHHSRHMQDGIKTLWNQYYTEYVASLNHFVKVTRYQPHEYEVGDFVHVLHGANKKEARTLPGAMHGWWGRYLIGRITAIHPGRDGQQRVFEVKKQFNDDVQRYSYMDIAPLFL